MSHFSLKSPFESLPQPLVKEKGSLLGREGTRIRKTLERGQGDTRSTRVSEDGLDQISLSFEELARKERIDWMGEVLDRAEQEASALTDIEEKTVAYIHLVDGAVALHRSPEPYFLAMLEEERLRTECRDQDTTIRCISSLVSHSAFSLSCIPIARERIAWIRDFATVAIQANLYAREAEHGQPPTRDAIVQLRCAATVGSEEGIQMYLTLAKMGLLNTQAVTRDEIKQCLTRVKGYVGSRRNRAVGFTMEEFKQVVVLEKEIGDYEGTLLSLQQYLPANDHYRFEMEVAEDKELPASLREQAFDLAFPHMPTSVMKLSALSSYLDFSLLAAEFKNLPLPTFPHFEKEIFKEVGGGRRDTYLAYATLLREQGISGWEEYIDRAKQMARAARGDEAKFGLRTVIRHEIKLGLDARLTIQDTEEALVKEEVGMNRLSGFTDLAVMAASTYGSDPIVRHLFESVRAAFDEPVEDVPVSLIEEERRKLIGAYVAAVKKTCEQLRVVK